MARLITKFKYLKPNRKLGGYARYIATREQVDKIDDTQKFLPATKKQKELIRQILCDFPDTKDSFEYQDYLKKMDRGSASEVITQALENNMDSIENTKTYVDYIATRPRAERFGSHGLFTDDNIPVQLKKVSDELNSHQGNVWTMIVSLRRKDAERLGFDNGIRWRDLLRTQTETLASNLKIPMEHLKWFAAFHNESHHPHIHLIAYSTVKNEGYLTRQGMENIRSSLAKDIFAGDLESVYEEQTEYRNQLRQEEKQMAQRIVEQICTGSDTNQKIEQLLLQLADRLSRTKGKKVYGYLKADVKGLVDSIVDELAKDQRISRLYELWYLKKENIHGIYSNSSVKRVPLSQNPEFKPIRNAVIQEALKLNVPTVLVSEGDGQKAVICSVLRLFQELARIFSEKIGIDDPMLKTDRKLRKQIQEKKHQLGLK
ncbi:MULTISPECIES: MobP3 family relaxase [Clostridiaceae]|uniref:Serine/threonine protein phosphatase n=1 Tax=Clostridium facile TaxID=2763035 RepID=A0ABR7IPK8_9CLOT|nr:MobP3 family relaxase [Massilioclostridium coli]MBC5787056.1 hypothetical protein [Clostridium facile]